MAKTINLKSFAGKEKFNPSRKDLIRAVKIFLDNDGRIDVLEPQKISPDRQGLIIKGIHSMQRRIINA